MNKAAPSTNILGISIPLKYVSLTVLVVQITMMVLVLRASRTGGATYVSSTAVLLAEFVKLITCLCLVFNEQQCNWFRFKNVLKRQVFAQGWESIKILVPACLYVIQNNLLFIALSNLDAATYQVTYQLKILTTAFFSVVILRRHLVLQKWVSLLILTFGVSLVQLSTLSPEESVEEVLADAKTGDQLVGLACVIGACFLSGLAGVYLELVLKFSKPSVWVRNIQLSLFSLIPATIAVFWTDGHNVMENGFFYGYTPIVWCVVILQACSGLIVALVVKYADNILKGFASAISIILSSLFSLVFFSFEPSFQWIGGTSLVLFSTILYSFGKNSPHQNTSPVLPTKNLVPQNV